MQTNPTDRIPWRDRAFVSITEAGQIIARSSSWVRDRIDEGRLRGCRVTAGGPLVVEVPSLMKLIDSAVTGLPTPRHPHVLRLVVDNTRS